MNPPSGSGLTQTPTAQTWEEERLETPNSMLFWVPRLGLLTSVHADPSQCSVRVREAAPAACDSPTAHTSPEPTALTEVNSFAPEPPLGVGTIVHDEPSQCSASAPR